MKQTNVYQITRDLIFKSFREGGFGKYRKVLSDFKAQSTCGRQIARSTWQHSSQQGGHGGQGGTFRFRTAMQYLNEQLNVLGVLFARQCNAIVAQRVRRAMQISGMFHRLGYDTTVIHKVIEKFGHNFRGKDQPLYLMLAACLFSWKDNAISNEEVDKYVTFH